MNNCNSVLKKIYIYSDISDNLFEENATPDIFLNHINILNNNTSILDDDVISNNVDNKTKN